jgi:hypothetical protein
MNKQKTIDTLKGFSYFNKNGSFYGIWSVDFWGIRDIVRIQFSRKHVEFLEFDELIPRVLEYFNEEKTKRELTIEDLKSLPHENIYVGYGEQALQKSYVYLGDVIKLLNTRGKEHSNFENSIKALFNDASTEYNTKNSI